MKMPPQTLVYTTGGWADASARKELWEYDAVEFTCANLNDRYYEISGEASYDPTFVAATQMQIVSADGEDDSDNLEENTLVDDQNYNATSFDED